MNGGGENSRIKEVFFDGEELTAAKIDCIKKILHRIEYIDIRSNKLD